MKKERKKGWISKNAYSYRAVGGVAVRGQGEAGGAHKHAGLALLRPSCHLPLQTQSLAPTPSTNTIVNQPHTSWNHVPTQSLGPGSK